MHDRGRDEKKVNGIISPTQCAAAQWGPGKKLICTDTNGQTCRAWKVI